MMKSVDMLLLERERILLHKSLTNKTLEKGGGGVRRLLCGLLLGVVNGLKIEKKRKKVERHKSFCSSTNDERNPQCRNLGNMEWGGIESPAASPVHPIGFYF